MLAAVLQWLAQAAPTASGGSSLDWPTVLISYGVAAPFVTYLLIDSSRKDKRLEEMQKRNESLTDSAIDKFAPLTVEATSALREAGQEIRALAAERDQLRSLHMVNQIDSVTTARVTALIDRMEKFEREHKDA